MENIVGTYYYKEMMNLGSIDKFIKKHQNIEVLLLEKELFERPVVKLYLNTKTKLFIVKDKLDNKYEFKNLLDAYHLFLDTNNSITV